MAHVLIADDDPHIREVVRFALERDGHRVTEAGDGGEALALHERGGAQGGEDPGLDLGEEDDEEDEGKKKKAK